MPRKDPNVIRLTLPMLKALFKFAVAERLPVVKRGEIHGPIRHMTFGTKPEKRLPHITLHMALQLQDKGLVALEDDNKWAIITQRGVDELHNRDILPKWFNRL